MTRTHVERNVRVGVFGSVESARRAVDGLLAAGFATDRISVVCSDEAKERLFSEFRHDEPAGTKTPATATAGAILGGIAGGVVGMLAGGDGATLAVTGPLGAGTGMAVGTFIGAMTSRGFEREVANFYDQALRRGQILVAGEIEPEGDRARLARAEEVFAQAGAHPVKLPEG
jgi:hypothetical protein